MTNNPQPAGNQDDPSAGLKSWDDIGKLAPAGDSLIAAKVRPFFNLAGAELSFYQSDNFIQGSQDISVSGDFTSTEKPEGISLKDLGNSLNNLTGQADWIGQFPVQVPDFLDNICLKAASVRLTVDADGVDLAFLGFKLAFKPGFVGSDWKPFGELISVSLTALQFSIRDPLNSVDSRQIWARFEGKLQVLGLTLDVSVDAPALSILTEYSGQDQTDGVGKALGGLPKLPAAGLNQMQFMAVPGTYYSLLLDANVDLPWQVGGKSWQIHASAAMYYNVPPASEGQLSGFPISGWRFEADVAQADPENPVGFPIQGLLEKLAEELDVFPATSAPTSLDGFAVLGFSLAYNTTTQDFKLSATGLLPLDGGGQPGAVEETPRVMAQVDVQIEHPTAGVSQKTFGGILTFILEGGKRFEFDLVFQSGAETSTFLALYRDQSGMQIAVSELVALASPSLGGSIPSSLTFNLKQALYAYTAGTNSKHLFGLEFGGGINLADIQLADLPFAGGSLVAPEQKLELAFRLLAASATFGQDDITRLEGLVRDGLGLPADKIEKVTVQASLNMGEQTQQLNLPVGASNSGLANTASLGANDLQAAQTSEQATAVTQDGVQWLAVQKTFGPVYFERVGLQVQAANIRAVLDASFTVSALKIAMQGLTMTSPLAEFKPQFSLQGLSVDFKTSDLEIGGAFLRQELARTIAGQTQPEKSIVYGGMAVIRASKLTLSAIGSYTSVGGQPSLFIYAVLDYPIGGPAFFFVRGLTAAFGYNRSLQMPEIDEVGNFPLIQQARSANPALLGGGDQKDQQNALVSQLAALEKYIPADPGQYFLGVGIHFTSFNIVDSVVLLNVQFGRQVEIDLLGSADLTAPAGAGAATPVARAKLNLKARYVPSEGFLSVLGKLTSDSYILSQACHLQGGFAFYAWFSGERAGDFCLTLGGYHPQYKPPAHYPQVPRLGLFWQVNDKLSVKGSAYFALTPHAIMAGGNLEATWEDGSVRAWFKAGIDFLINWQPYHYDAHAYVSIGASYTFDTWFGTRTVSGELGADVHVWGPEFALTAEVHYYIFSVRVEYNTHQAAKTDRIDWPAFQKAFLPAEKQVCGVAVLGGLLYQIGSGQEGTAVMDFKAPAFTINTAIPVNRVQFGSDKQFGTLNLQGNDTPIYFTNQSCTQAQAYRLDANYQILPAQDTTASKAFGLPGVLPSRVDPADFDSLLKVSITQSATSKDVTNQFTFTPVLKSVPAALWGKPGDIQPADPNPKTPLVLHTLMGFELRTAATDKRPEGIDACVLETVKLGQAALQGDSFPWEKTDEIEDDTTYMLSAKARRDGILQALGMSEYHLDLG